MDEQKPPGIKDLSESHHEAAEREVANDPEAIQFDYRCKWSLSGTIEHWGHIHERENEYEAEFRVSLVDKAWKLTQMEVVDESQGVVKTCPRQF